MRVSPASHGELDECQGAGRTSRRVVDEVDAAEAANLGRVLDGLALGLAPPAGDDDDGLANLLARHVLAELARVGKLHADELLDGVVRLRGRAERKLERPVRRVDERGEENVVRRVGRGT